MATSARTLPPPMNRGAYVLLLLYNLRWRTFLLLLQRLHSIATFLLFIRDRFGAEPKAGQSP